MFNFNSQRDCYTYRCLGVGSPTSRLFSRIELLAKTKKIENYSNFSKF